MFASLLQGKRNNAMTGPISTPRAKHKFALLQPEKSNNVGNSGLIG